MVLHNVYVNKGSHVESTVQSRMFCLGCGENLSNARDRRSLANPGAKDVVDLWKSLMENKVDDLSVISPILQGQDNERPPKMCKKCFTAYRTCARQHVALDNNLRKAADTLGLVCCSSEAGESPPAPKRPRISLSSESDSRGSTSGITTSSPDIAISVLTFKAKNSTLLFLSIQIRVGYTQPKTFVLTPNRKHLGKAVARNSKKTIAAETLKDSVTKGYIVSIMGRELSREIRAMASDHAKSILQSQNPHDLKQFKWDTLLCELSKYAPVLSRLLLLATKTKLDHKAVIRVCAAILINHQNSKMNLIQKLASLILYTSHASKQVCIYTYVHVFLLCCLATKVLIGKCHTSSSPDQL